MANTLVRVYDHFFNAQDARTELIKAGFPMDEVNLTSQEDEAGPLKSNFAVGNGRGEAGLAVWSNTSVKNREYLRNYAAPPLQQGSFVLTVDTHNDDDIERACAIMKKFGAFDVDERAGRRNM